MANAYSHDAMCALNSAVACANCAWRRSRIPDTSSIESAASDLFVRVADNRGVEWPAPAASCSAARRRCLRRGRAKHGRQGRRPGLPSNATSPAPRGSGAWSWMRSATPGRSNRETRARRSCPHHRVAVGVHRAPGRGPRAAPATRPARDRRPPSAALRRGAQGLEELVTRAPDPLRTFLLSRRDPKPSRARRERLRVQLPCPLLHV